jgi:hypothetical protein
MAAKKDWKFTQGDDSTITFYYQDLEGVGLAPSGTRIFLGIKETVKHTSEDLSVEGNLLDVTTGQIQIDMTKEATANMIGRFVYDIKIVLPSGTVKTLLAGAVEFAPKITDVSSASGGGGGDSGYYDDDGYWVEG